MSEEPIETAAFDVAAALLQIIAEPAVAKKRLGELRAASDDLAKREAQLAQDREAFDEHRRRIVAEIDQRRASVQKQWELVFDERNRAWMNQKADQSLKAQREATA